MEARSGVRDPWLTAGWAASPPATRGMGENRMAVNCRLPEQCFTRCAEGGRSSGLGATCGAPTVRRAPSGVGRERWPSARDAQGTSGEREGLCVISQSR